MKRTRPHRLRVLLICAALAGAPLFAGLAGPHVAYAQSTAKFSSQQIDSLTAPVALYPDALLAQVLMAATFAQDVRAANAWAKANVTLKGDAAVRSVASQPWDPSVQSLVAFPQVLAAMAAKPDWSTQLGNAFLAQPGDVMDSVQRLRRDAQQTGNLKTTEQQKVVVERNTLQIVPVDPQVVYVPTYNPTVVYGVWPYPAYPPVYVPPPPGYAIASGFAAGLAFGAGVAVANALWGGFDWHTHCVNINVNRYNNINVNNRLDVHNTTVNWNRNTTLDRNIDVSRSQLDASRERDRARVRAQRTLQNRTGQTLGGNASERVQGIHQGGVAHGDAVDARGADRPANRDNTVRSRDERAAASKHAQRSGAFGAPGSGQPLPSRPRASFERPLAGHL